MRFGEMVKIDDIGQPALFIRRDGKEVELELFGVRFWLPDYLVSAISDEDEDAA